jgi:hypothetical protein
MLSSSADAPVRDVYFTDPDPTVASWLSELDVFPESSAIGSSELPNALVLGKIVDGVVIPAKPGHTITIALLDASYGMVRVFTLDGAPHTAFGGLGAGPGEVTSPVALEHRDGMLVVLDAAMKIERYELIGRQWQHADRVPLPVDAQSVCITDDGFAVLGLRSGELSEPGQPVGRRTVHLISERDQETTESFAEPYRHESELAVWSMARGKLVCDPGRRLLWVAYSALRELHAYHFGGNLRWIARLKDMNSPDFIETGGTRIRRDLGSSATADVISHISLLDDMVLAVQVASYSTTRTPSEPRQVDFRTYFVDANTGTGLGGIRAKHQVIGGGQSRAILYRDDPFPQVAVVALRR